MGINFAAASTAGLNNPGTEIITLVKDGSSNFINPPSYDKIRAYLSSGEVPMLFVTDEAGETGSLYQLVDYSETENKIRFSNDVNAVEFSAGAVAPVVSDVVPKPLTYDYMPEGYPKKTIGTVTVMGEQELEFVSPGDGLPYIGSLTTTFTPVEGQTYIVNWDGTEYECVCSVFNGRYLVLGNLSIIGAGGDTGEPFIYLNTSSAGSEFETFDTASSHTISVKKTGEIATPMADEFLPVASEDKYGVVKKTEIVTSYNFEQKAPHDQMVDAIAAFKTGNASIVWRGVNVINASYSSSDDTISVTFANEPLRSQTFSNTNGFYNKAFGAPIYGELQGSQVRIINDTNVYAVLAVEGEPPNITLSTSANRIAINGAWGMSTTEIILKSSTEGSSKNFKITVDDSGTISATELT